MTPRPDLLVLAAELEAHLSRAQREVVSIDELASGESVDERTLWALAGHLQAFHTGCETVIRRALEKFDGPPDEGPDSHRHRQPGRAPLTPVFGKICDRIVYF